MGLVDELAISGVLYAVSVAVQIYSHRQDARNSPEKGRRYSALPIHYKALCYLGVLPLFAAIPFFPGSFFLGIVAFMGTEVLCIKWYRKNGLL